MTDHRLAPMLRMLQTYCPLPAEDAEAILRLPHAVRTVASSTYLIREGEPPQVCTVLLSGFAYRHKIVGDGGRQIVSVHVPGEALDLQSLYLDCADHNAQALTAAEVAIIPLAALRELVEARPEVARSVVTNLLVEASILREWITNIGRRDARSRLAHLLCEFASRLDAQSIARSGYALPMTQEQIGDALGLTSVHVNRTIRTMEAEGLVQRSGRTLTIPDIGRLRSVGDFGRLYLHLDQQREEGVNTALVA